MPKSLWYNVNEKTNFVFTAAEGNFFEKDGIFNGYHEFASKEKNGKKIRLV